VVYALQKFCTYTFGRHVRVFLDNKALSFMKKCTLVSSRITHWIMQIQEYDLEIVYIKGRDNCFGGFISRNPTGLTGQQINYMNRTRDILVTTINLGLDPQFRKD
jgi:hypothetical protein